MRIKKKKDENWGYPHDETETSILFEHKLRIDVVQVPLNHKNIWLLFIPFQSFGSVLGASFLPLVFSDRSFKTWQSNMANRPALRCHQLRGSPN